MQIITLKYGSLDVFDQCIHIFGCGSTFIDDEATMLFRDLGASDAEPLKPAVLYQFPCEITFRTFEDGTTAGVFHGLFTPALFM